MSTPSPLRMTQRPQSTPLEVGHPSLLPLDSSSLPWGGEQRQAEPAALPTDSPRNSRRWELCCYVTCGIAAERETCYAASQYGEMGLLDAKGSWSENKG